MFLLSVIRLILHIFSSALCVMPKKDIQHGNGNLKMELFEDETVFKQEGYMIIEGISR